MRISDWSADVCSSGLHASRPYGGFIPAPAAGQDALSFILGAPGDYFYKVTDDALMGTAGLRYEFSPSVMAYAKYSRGFKAGGYNAIAVAPIRGTDIPPTFGPEFVNAYEVGFKKIGRAACRERGCQYGKN